MRFPYKTKIHEDRIVWHTQGHVPISVLNCNDEQFTFINGTEFSELHGYGSSQGMLHFESKCSVSALWIMKEGA